MLLDVFPTGVMLYCVAEGRRCTRLVDDGAPLKQRTNVSGVSWIPRSSLHLFSTTNDDNFSTDVSLYKGDARSDKQ
jgi:hypothetical protein